MSSPLMPLQDIAPILVASCNIIDEFELIIQVHASTILQQPSRNLHRAIQNSEMFMHISISCKN